MKALLEREIEVFQGKHFMTAVRRCRPFASEMEPLITFVIGRLRSTPVYLVTLSSIYHGSATGQLCDLKLILNLTESFLYSTINTFPVLFRS